MRKILAVALITSLIFASLPLNHSEQIATPQLTLPTMENIIGFLTSLQKKVETNTFYQNADIIEMLYSETGTSVYTLGDANPLSDAIAALYETQKIAYNQSDITAFISQLNMSDEEYATLALLIFSYVNVLESIGRQEQLEAAFDLFRIIKATSAVLRYSHINNTVVDSYDILTFGGATNDIFNTSLLVVIDFDGDDVYQPRENAFILDLHGNDSYIQQDALYGFNFIVDLEGNDEYRDTPTSIGGINLLYDLFGNDTYYGTVVTAHETGQCALIDMEGNDLYSGINYTQCFANDGTALLFDMQGNDSYTAESHSQACSYGGIAALIDGYGDDIFSSGDCSQSYATGILSNGFTVLLNLAGNDLYSAGDFSQGYGEGGCVALFLDILGEDSYTAHYYSQAATAMTGIAALVDSQEHNIFSSASFSQGYHGILGETFFLPRFNFNQGTEFLEFLAELQSVVLKLLPYIFEG